MAHLPPDRVSSVFFLFSDSFSGKICSFTHVCSEHHEVVVLVDVVHDLRLQEGLSSIIHDLVAELGFSNVLSKLLDSSSSSFGRSVFVNDFVTLVLCSSSILQSSNKLLDNLKFAPEKSIL